MASGASVSTATSTTATPATFTGFDAPEDGVDEDAAAQRGQSLQASGTVDIDAPPERVYAVLTDPQALARVIPGCHALRDEGQGRYAADVTVGVGPIKARYAARLVLSDLDPPHGLRLSGSGESALGSAAGGGRVRLVPHGSGTRLHYQYRSRVGGRVAAVGSRMLEGAARVVLAQLFDSLGRQAVAAQQATPRAAESVDPAHQLAQPSAASPTPATGLWPRLRAWLARRIGGAR